MSGVLVAIQFEEPLSLNQLSPKIPEQVTSWTSITEVAARGATRYN